MTQRQSRDSDAPPAPLHQACPRCSVELAQDYKFCPRCAYRLRPDLFERRPAEPAAPSSRGTRIIAVGGYLAFASLLLLVIFTTLRLFIEEPNPAGAVVHRVVVGEVRDRDVLPVSSRDLHEVQGGEAIWGLYREDLYESDRFFEDPLSYPKIDSAYALGLYEVTNDQYLSFLLAVAERTGLLADNRVPSHWTRSSGGESFAVSRVYARGTGDWPVVNVPVLDALEYANWYWEERLHADPDRIADLPTADEFVRAGRGDKLEHNFPWGPAFGSEVSVNWTRRQPVAVNSLEAGNHRGLYALLGNAAEWVYGPGSRMLAHAAGGSFDLRHELYNRYIKQPWPDATPFQATTFDWRATGGQKDVGFRLVVRPAAHRPTMVAVARGMVRYRKPDERRIPPTTPDTEDPTVWDQAEPESDDEFLPSVNLTLPIPAVWYIGSAFYHERDPDPDEPRRIQSSVAGVKLDRGDGVRAEFTQVSPVDDGTDGTEGLTEPVEIESRELKLGGQTAQLRRWSGQIGDDKIVRLVVEAHMGHQRYRLRFDRPEAADSAKELDTEFEAMLAATRFQTREIEDPEADFRLRVPSDPAWELEARKLSDAPPDGGSVERSGGRLRARATRKGKASVAVYRRPWSGVGVFPREFPGVAADEPLLGTAEGVLEEPAEFNGLGAIRRTLSNDGSGSAFLFPRRLIDGNWVYAFVVRRIVLEPDVESQLRRIASSFRFLHEEPVPLPSGEALVEDDFAISRTPITNRQYLAFLVDHADDHDLERMSALRPLSFSRRTPRSPERLRTYEGAWGDPTKIAFVYVPGTENQPVLLGTDPDLGFGTATEIALLQATTYAAWLGAQDADHTYRLPTFTEYLRAGRGDAVHRFPWGEKPDDPDLVCRGDWYEPDELRPVFLPGRLGSQARAITGLCGNVLEFVLLDGDPVLAGGWHDLTPDYCTLDSVIDSSWWPNADEPRGFRVVKEARK